MRTISEIKTANKQAGWYFFEPDTMRFFNSRIGSRTWESPEGGEYFITSEQRDYDSPRLYTIRRAYPDGHVDTVGDFQGYRTSREAQKAIKELIA